MRQGTSAAGSASSPAEERSRVSEYKDQAVLQVRTLEDSQEDRSRKQARPGGHRRLRGRIKLLLGGIAGVALCVAVIAFILGTAAPRVPPTVQETAHQDGTISEYDAAIPVNTVFPTQKTLVLTLEQPGSIKPWAQAELYAKVSGNLKWIQRQPTPELAVQWWARDLAAVALMPCGLPFASVANLAANANLAVAQSPQKDIGSSVTAGELLLEIDVPDLVQEIAQKQALLEQKVAELEHTRTTIATFEAAVEAANAQKKQAEADVKKSESEHIFCSKQLRRLMELAQDKAVTEEVVDEKHNHVAAALAAWESSRAKVQAVQAELSVISSKLATARADIQIKGAQVQVAREELHRARLLADYARIRAPFDGIIAFRGVDEGDFIQNASTGQTRLLMTVMAVDKVRVVLQVPEEDSPWVQVGAEATIHVDARRKTSWYCLGRVSRKSDSLDSPTRTMRVEIDLDNADRKLKPGMYGQVALTLQKLENAQAIPATALYSRKTENYILVLRDGVARRQRVRVRYDDGKELEVVKIIDGKEIPLDGTDALIVSNKGEIGDGQKVRATPLNGY